MVVFPTIGATDQGRANDALREANPAIDPGRILSAPTGGPDLLSGQDRLLDWTYLNPAPLASTRSTYSVNTGKAFLGWGHSLGRHVSLRRWGSFDPVVGGVGRMAREELLGSTQTPQLVEVAPSSL